METPEKRGTPAQGIDIKDGNEGDVGFFPYDWNWLDGTNEAVVARIIFNDGKWCITDVWSPRDDVWKDPGDCMDLAGDEDELFVEFGDALTDLEEGEQ